MGILDIFVIVILVISVFLGLTQGFIKQAASIISWIAAVIVPLFFTDEVVKIVIASENQGDFYSSAIVFACLFVLTFMIVRIIGKILSSSLKKAGIGFFDSLLGAIWGFMKAIIIVSLIFLLFEWLASTALVGDTIQQFLINDMNLGADKFGIAKYLYENNLIIKGLEEFKK